jgi:glycosyltransferase involved in cell wall biosynthesis
LKKILYISYTGILEPLGSSQVLNYIRELSKDFSFWLITLEKIDDLKDDKESLYIKKSLSEFGIIWLYLPYKPGAINYVKNLKNVFSLSRSIIKSNNINFIHCRSYMPTIVAYTLKKLGYQVDYLFDTRGFWFDEKADVGEWSRSRFIYKLSKKFEKSLYLNAFSIVMLSRKSVELIRNGYFFKGSEKVENIYFIPTCTDLEKFKPNFEKENSPIKIGYIGTAIGWYNFEKTAKLLQLIKQELDFELEIYNGGQHDFIKKTLLTYGFNKGSYSLQKVKFDEIPSRMRNFDISIFFIHPFYSKNASAATKFGELMASGIPILTNKNVGDHESFINEYKTGKILDTEKLNSYNFKTLLNSLTNKQTQKNCRNLAEEVFSLQKGVVEYTKIYEQYFK